jgi:4-hydroxy-4-methyl-2-oxoglutarate aldolase
MAARHQIVRNIHRADPKIVQELGHAGVATVHEASGRIGLVGPAVQARQQGLRVAGSAVTVLSHPGDNLMIHAAIEVCQPGDILVVATTSLSTDGMFGELFATSLMSRGVSAVVSDAGVRDIAELRDMRFGVWSRAIHAQGTVKASPGSVNVPIVVDGHQVSPGDILLADDDGVLTIRASVGKTVLDSVRHRLANEQTKREHFAAGELGIDIHGFRELLEQLGVTSVDRQ